MLSNNRGITLVQVLIALTTVIILAIFGFYFFSTLAYASSIPSGPCEEYMGPNCQGSFTLEDMVVPDSYVEGYGWAWDPAFWQAYGQWLANTGVENKPYKTSESLKIDNVRVDRRKYADSANDHTRFTFRVIGASEVTYIPDLWLDNGEMFGNYGEGGLMNFKEVSRIEQPVPNLDSVVWEGEAGEPYINQRTEILQMVKYNTGLRDWYMSGEPMIFDPVYHYKFYHRELVANETLNFVITLGGIPYPINVPITNVDEMPSIPAFYTQTVGVSKTLKSGKVIDNSHEVTTPNINVREVIDPDGQTALVIQWAEPDGAFFGNTIRWDQGSEDTFMLRIYIGKWSENPSKEVYLWVDCPVQTGTVVIPANAYNWLKQEIVSQGMATDGIETFILYRTVTDRWDGTPNYHNRGISDTVTFTPGM